MSHTNDCNSLFTSKVSQPPTMLSPSPVRPLQISIVVSQPGIMGHVTGSEAKVAGVEHLLEPVTITMTTQIKFVINKTHSTPRSLLYLLLIGSESDVKDGSVGLGVILGSAPEHIWLDDEGWEVESMQTKVSFKACYNSDITYNTVQNFQHSKQIVYTHTTWIVT